MNLVNDKEGLYLKAVRVKSLATEGKLGDRDDVITVCNGLLQCW